MSNVQPTSRPYYERAWKALRAAHEACFRHPDRGALGMSHGPFAGVNEALGIVDELEYRLWLASLPQCDRAAALEAWIEREFAGHGRALRTRDAPPLEGEPWMSMADAKELTRRAVRIFGGLP